MEYKIISAVESTGQIEVAYLHDNTVVGVFAIDIPIIDGRYLSPSELAVEIQHRAPTFIPERKIEVSNATGFAEIAALVEPIQTAMTEAQKQQTDNAVMWAQIEFEKQIAVVLVKFGVLNTDPTTIAIGKL